MMLSAAAAAITTTSTTTTRTAASTAASAGCVLRSRVPTWCRRYAYRYFTSAGGGGPGGAAAAAAPPPPPPPGVYNKIGFLGVGKMAQAMLEPMIKTGLQPPTALFCYDVETEAMEHVSENFPGVRTTQCPSEVVDGADLVVCCVKPQNLSESFFDSLGTPHPDTTLLSVVGGSPMSVFQGGGFRKVARSMPNTPARIQKGMTVWTCTNSVSSDERDKIKEVLCSFGKTLFVDDEKYIDMSTSISGSGPAYVFMLIEALTDAGVHLGFSRDIAQQLVNHTLLGSTLYAMETGEHPVVLRNSVTSPGGTTASALYELENGKFRTVIKDAVWACYRRSLEMGSQNSNVGPGRQSGGRPSSKPN